MPQPKLLHKPWADDGLRNDIPAARTTSLAQEAATYTDGFPSVTMTPIALGGKPPSGKDMNGILNEITSHIVYQNKGERYRFDQDFCSAIGGYPKGAVLMSDTGDAEYISTVDRNTTNPNSGGANWRVFSGNGKVDKTTTIAAGNGLTGGGTLDANSTLTLGTPSSITASSTNSVTTTSHTHAIDQASTSTAGIVQLSTATNSTATNMAATPSAVKAAYDLAVAAQNSATQSAPSGTIAFFAGGAAPNGWLKANGAAVSRTTYAALFAAIGTTYGAGDGSTTFNLPDLRGEFIRGWDDGRGVDKGRVLGSAQGDAIRDIRGRFSAYRRTDREYLVMPSGAFKMLEKVNGSMRGGDPDDWAMTIDFAASNVVPTADENRPRNIALLACIKI